MGVPPPAGQETKWRFPKGGKEVSAMNTASGTRKPLVIVLAVVGVVAIIVGILWFVGATPSFLNVGSHVKGHGGHLIRGAVAAVVGIGLLVFAWIQNKKS